MKNVGFMQGRLSPIIDNKIQCFPFDYWEDEFSKAKELKINCMEWTLDYPKFKTNPIFSEKSRKKILDLSSINKISIPSITLDCCMQRPFWKEQDEKKYIELLDDFELIIDSANTIGIEMLIIPLVDNGSIINKIQIEKLKNVISSFQFKLKSNDMKIAFESDFPPVKLKDLINEFNYQFVGINYDTGNSASLGFDSDEEFFSYGRRIINVHIKDRIYNGSTVRLGLGDVNFKKVFHNLNSYNYDGNFILQTARSPDNKHSEELKNNLSFLKKIKFFDLLTT